MLTKWAFIDYFTKIAITPSLFNNFSKYLFLNTSTFQELSDGVSNSHVTHAHRPRNMAGRWSKNFRITICFTCWHKKIEKSSFFFINTNNKLYMLLRPKCSYWTKETKETNALAPQKKVLFHKIWQKCMKEYCHSMKIPTLWTPSSPRDISKGYLAS